MLSILIPTYQRDCSALVLDLLSQAESFQRTSNGAFSYELIVGDDGSKGEAIEQLERALAGKPHCRLLRQTRNHGRAANCNQMAREAKGDWLLIIDDDAAVCSDTFIRDYWAVRLQADVVCGSLRNPPPPAPKGHELRYRYEKKAEPRRRAAWRNRRPYDEFTTFNVLFSRRAFDAVQFDERCTEYGYEDVLMGLMLKERGFSVLHADIPLVHTGIDSNENFLRNTEASMRVLARIGEPLTSYAGASRTLRTLRRFGLGRVPIYIRTGAGICAVSCRERTPPSFSFIPTNYATTPP